MRINIANDGLLARLTALLVSVLLIVPNLFAGTWTETEDAGEFLFTADFPDGQGPLTRIDGNLVNLGGQVDDIDLYRIYINAPETFSVVTSASLSVDNDAQLYLFDAGGELVAWDDDGLDDDNDLQPEFFAGEIAGLQPGYYYLAYHLFTTKPTLSAGTSGKLVGWARNPEPYQTGAYSLFLSGALQQLPALIHAGSDQQVSLPGPASLNGLHWGMPPSGVFHGWYQTEGPGVVTFGDPRAAQTTATFSQPGEYTLLFWIYLGGFYPATDEIIITVTP